MDICIHHIRQKNEFSSCFCCTLLSVCSLVMVMGSNTIDLQIKYSYIKVLNYFVLQIFWQMVWKKSWQMYNVFNQWLTDIYITVIIMVTVIITVTVTFTFTVADKFTVRLKCKLSNRNLAHIFKNGFSSFCCCTLFNICSLVI